MQFVGASHRQMQHFEESQKKIRRKGSQTPKIARFYLCEVLEQAKLIETTVVVIELAAVLGIVDMKAKGDFLE